MSRNIARTTPGLTNCMARFLTTARLHFNTPAESPKNWGEVTPNLNDFHAYLMEISSTFWILDITDWWHQPLEIHTKYAILSNVAPNLFSLTSATTLISVWNTQVFRTALTAQTEPLTLWQRFTRSPSHRRRVALHTYLLYFVVTYTHGQNDTCVTLFAGAAVMLKLFFRSVSDHRRAFLPAFRVTWSAGDKPGSTSNHSHVFCLYSDGCIYVSI